jgi:hypothetical protein
MAIQKDFPSNPDVVLYSAINIIQMWRDLVKDADKMHLSEMVKVVGTWISKCHRLQTFNSDVVISTVCEEESVCRVCQGSFRWSPT